ncbi:MAG: DUF1207 domain-containing protein [Pirellulales bacterium]
MIASHRITCLLAATICWATSGVALAQYRFAPGDGYETVVDPQAGVVHVVEPDDAAYGHSVMAGPQIDPIMVGEDPQGYATGTSHGGYEWQILPLGHIYRSYLAGPKEPRMGINTFYETKEEQTLVDATLGGRFGLLRYGNQDAILPQGFQVDIEGAAFPRLSPNESFDLRAVDFRAGVPLTFGFGRWRTKFGYYHTSSHIGDEFLIKNPTFDRLNYVRDALVFGASYFPNDDLRIYAEAAWAFHVDDGAEPWELQFGIEYSPITGVRSRSPFGRMGWLNGKVISSPYLAANGYLREELQYSGNIRRRSAGSGGI